jgi:hypothetical protein
VLVNPSRPHHGATRAKPSKVSTNLTIASTVLAFALAITKRVDSLWIVLGGALITMAAG